MVMDAPLNLRITRHAEIMGRHDPSEGWAERVTEDGRNRSVWISGPPGTPPDPHIHPDFNEWWIALDGHFCTITGWHGRRTERGQEQRRGLCDDVVGQDFLTERR